MSKKSSSDVVALRIVTNVKRTGYQETGHCSSSAGVLRQYEELQVENDWHKSLSNDKSQQTLIGKKQ